MRVIKMEQCSSLPQCLLCAATWIQTGSIASRPGVGCNPSQATPRVANEVSWKSPHQGQSMTSCLKFLVLPALFDASRDWTIAWQQWFINLTFPFPFILKS